MTHAVFLLSQSLSGAFLAHPGVPSPRTLLAVLLITAGVAACFAVLDRTAQGEQSSRGEQGSPSAILDCARGWLLPPAAGILCAMGPAGAWIAVRAHAGASMTEDSLPAAFLCAFCALRIMGSRQTGSTGAKVANDFGAGIAQFLAAACLGFLYTSTFAGPYPLLALIALTAFLFWEHEQAVGPGSPQGAKVANDFGVRRAPLAAGKYALRHADAVAGILVLAFVAAGVTIPEP